MKYKSPTPVQAWTIPAILAGGDVIAISQTGEFISFFPLNKI